MGEVGVFLLKLKKIDIFLGEFHTSIFVADLWRVRKFYSHSPEGVTSKQLMVVYYKC